MATRSEAPGKRQRGSIRRRARCYEIRVSAGDDPSTGERIVLVESVDIEGWMAQHEIDPTTRMTYDAQIRLYIESRLGDVPLRAKSWAVPLGSTPRRGRTTA